jgi:4-amino-4-deoxy-L-arabinose transferase-like glycosyltransferase
MENARVIKEHWQSLVFLLILVFAAGLYLFNINFSEIWCDEAFTKALVRQPFSELLKSMHGEFNPPLYFLGLKAFTGIVGSNDFTIRLFSVIGALSTLAMGYFVGQRVFGKGGALCYCAMVLSLPMLGAFTHTARMYTWAAFATTGVFLYACLFLKENRKGDLLLLGILSAMAAYTHYYSLIAAFWADAFVLVYLLVTKNKAWRWVAVMGIVVFVVFLPWLFVMLSQTHAAQKDFWIPPVSAKTLAACYLNPFGHELFLDYWSYPLAMVAYGLAIASVCASFVWCKKDEKTALWLSLWVFNLTIVTVVCLSFVLRPLLYHRYVMCVITMLAVPPAILLASSGFRWLKLPLLGSILCCGACIVIRGSYFSYGPYQQSLDHLLRTRPGIRKIVHITELTAGPFYEYGLDGPWRQYYMKNKDSAWYTNMEVFEGSRAIENLDEVLEKGDVFCMPKFPYVSLNEKSCDLILSQSEKLAEDTVEDKRANGVAKFPLYILKYRGKPD